MGNLIEDRKTQATPKEVAQAMARAWVELFEEVPSKGSILVLLSQWALETGRGKSCHNWNLGNAKAAADGPYDYTFYGCDEVLDAAYARRLVAASPLARVTKDYGNGTLRVWFDPPHPMTRFRAFASLEQGAVDYLSLLYNRFSAAWPAVRAGDPRTFVLMLSHQGYFTADVGQYLSAVVALDKEFDHLDLELDKLPVLSQHEKEQVMNLIFATSTLAVEDSFRQTSSGEQEDPVG